MLKKLVKILHTLGAVGVTGALVVYLVLHATLPSPEELAAYAALRTAIDDVMTWVLMPSLLVVLVSGLLSITTHRPFTMQGWVWFKALMGIVMFEGTLLAVVSPAGFAAEAARAAVDSGIAAVPADGREVAAVSAILVLALANIVVGVWRPRRAET